MNGRLGCRTLIYPLLILAVTSCLEPYNPPAITETVDILVVDGFVNSTDHSATVQLSKATPLGDNVTPVPELNASVRVEEENGTSFTLIEEGQGRYVLGNMNLNPSKKYRLYILTNREKQYFSDYVDLKASPEIDSITWGLNRDADGIIIFANTHDDTNKTKYYQWTFDETWEYTSQYFAALKIENGAVVPQPVNISRCWITKSSTEIRIAASVQLNEDVIRDFPLMFIQKGSQRISKRYSILVHQRALTKEAYDFWTQLKKTTEGLGGLFDPLPAQVLGNIYSADDSAEPVLGYFSGGNVSEKRMFINFEDLPTELKRYQTLFCPVDSILVSEVASHPNVLLIGSYGQPFTVGYTTSSASTCLDCRDGGGVIIRPDFW